jgi:hypothetical protein
VSEASDILRERARVAREQDRLRDAETIDAIADLLDACVTNSAGYFRCEICGAQASSKVYSECRAHMAYCALAAAERAITGATK